MLVECYWQGKTEVLGEKHYIVWVVGEWMGMEHLWNGTDSGKPKYWKKSQSHATLTAINLTWTDLVSKPNLRGEWPAIARLSHDTTSSAAGIETLNKKTTSHGYQAFIGPHRSAAPLHHYADRTSCRDPSNHVKARSVTVEANYAVCRAGGYL